MRRVVLLLIALLMVMSVGLPTAIAGSERGSATSTQTSPNTDDDGNGLTGDADDLVGIGPKNLVVVASDDRDADPIRREYVVIRQWLLMLIWLR